MSEETVDFSEELDEVLSRVKFAPSCVDFGWRWEYEEVFGAPPHAGHAVLKGWLVNTTFRRPDIETGEVGEGRGRKEFVALGTTVSGVVKTLWLLAELIVRHELMEAFHVEVDGQHVKIFNPHYTIDELALPRRKKSSAPTDWDDIQSVVRSAVEGAIGNLYNDDEMSTALDSFFDQLTLPPWEKEGAKFDPKHHERVDDRDWPVRIIGETSNGDDQRVSCNECGGLYSDTGNINDDCGCCVDCHEEHPTDNDGNCEAR